MRMNYWSMLGDHHLSAITTRDTAATGNFHELHEIIGCENPFSRVSFTPNSWWWCLDTVAATSRQNAGVIVLIKNPHSA
jgi:hypothetical protein